MERDIDRLVARRGQAWRASEEFMRSHRSEHPGWYSAYYSRQDVIKEAYGIIDRYGGAVRAGITLPMIETKLQGGR